MAEKKRMRALTFKLVAYSVTIIMTILLMIMILAQIQTRGQEEYQKKMSLVPLLDEIVEELDLKSRNVETLTNRFHSSNQTTLDMVELFMESGAFKELSAATDMISAATSLKNLTESTGMDSMMVVDSQGNLRLMDNVDFYRIMGSNAQYNMIKSDSNPAGVFSAEDFSYLTASADGWKGTSRATANGTEYAPVHTVTTGTDGSQYIGYYYSTPFNLIPGCYLVAMADANKMEKEIANLENIETVLGSIGVGQSGIVFSLDPETGNFVFFEDKDGVVLTGEKYKDSGVTDDILKDGYSGIQEIRGKKYYCVSKTYSSEVFGDCIVIVATIMDSELYGSRTSNVLWSVLAFVFVGILIITYAFIIQVDQIKKGSIFESRKILFKRKSGRVVYYNKALALKVFPLVIVGLVLILGISIYSQTLSQLTTAVNLSDSRINSIGHSSENNKTTSGTITDFFDKQNLYKTRLLADIIKNTPAIAFTYDLSDTAHYEYAKDTDNNRVLDDYGNPVLTGRYLPHLQALCDSFGLSSIYIFNDRGRVIATNQPWWNFVLSDDPEAQSYPFREVLMNSDSYVQELQANEVGGIEQYIGCAYYYYTYDDNGTTRFASEYEFKNGVVSADGKVLVEPSQITRHRGLIQTGISHQDLKDVLDMASLDYTLDSMNMFYEGFFIGFADDENHTVLYSPFDAETVIPKREAMFSGAFNGYITINGEKYFTCIRKVGDNFLGTAIPSSTLFSLRNNIATATALLSLLAFLILLSFMLYSNSDEDEMIKERLEEQEKMLNDEALAGGSANFDVTMPDGKKKRVKAASARWSKRMVAWKKKSVEQKFSFVVGLFGLVFIGIVIVALMLSRSVTKNSSNSILQYILKGNLERGVNLFVLTRCVIYIVMVLVASKIAQKFINTLTVNLGARAETVGHLLESFIKYGGVIGVLFFSLYLMGFETTSLLTSAGILSIVIGFGAQSLISDILAGIFIVFEGEFRAGDIVTVGDFRGTVLEIGIRTTKIEDFVGNIKIYNNSSISGVLNMTKEYSTVPITLGIEYGESLERVEAVLKEEFPAIKKKLKTIVNGPFYKGVSSLADSSVNLLVVAQCLEGDRIQLTRDLNRELYLVFNKHNINVPFPQVTLSYLDSSENTEATKKEAKTAEKFMEQQKEASANVDMEV